MNPQRKWYSWRSIVDENTVERETGTNMELSQLSTTKPQVEAIKIMKTTTDKLLSLQCSSLPNGYRIAHGLGTIDIEIRKSEQTSPGVCASDAKPPRSKDTRLLLWNGEQNSAEVSNQPLFITTCAGNTYFVYCFPLTIPSCFNEYCLSE